MPTLTRRLNAKRRRKQKMRAPKARSLSFAHAPLRFDNLFHLIDGTLQIIGAPIAAFRGSPTVPIVRAKI